MEGGRPEVDVCLLEGGEGRGGEALEEGGEGVAVQGLRVDLGDEGVEEEEAGEEGAGEVGDEGVGGRGAGGRELHAGVAGGGLDARQLDELRGAGEQLLAAARAHAGVQPLRPERHGPAVGGFEGWE